MERDPSCRNFIESGNEVDMMKREVPADDIGYFLQFCAGILMEDPTRTVELIWAEWICIRDRIGIMDTDQPKANAG